jgi:predicted permease
MGPVLMVLGWMALAVLVISAANVSGLLLARGLKRRRDLALRLAIGAERFDLVRLLAAESLLLALGGGAIGWVASRLALGALFSSFPPMNLPIAASVEIGVDGLGVGLGLVVLSAVASALSPMLLVRHASPIDGLRANSRDVGSPNASSNHPRMSLRRVLVGVQVALGALLLVTAALCQRALDRGLTLPTGFETRSILLAAIDLPSQGYDEVATRSLLDRLAERLRGEPGVVEVAAARRLPLDIAGISSAEVRVADSAAEAQGHASTVGFNTVSRGYFGAMGIGLEAGRDFRATDDGASAAVAVVSRAFAKRYWPEAAAEDAVGRTFLLGDDAVSVIGVAADIKIASLAETPRPFFYLPLSQASPNAVFVVVRTAGEPLAALPLLREALRALDPAVPLYSVKTMAEHFELGVYKQRLASRSLAVLGGVALILSIVGLYGLLAYFVALRTREIGLRRALGARAVDVLRLLGREGIRPALVGLALGLATAAATSGLLSGLLLGVSPRDPVAFGLATVVFLGTAAAALVVPARRALSVDPAVALRED